MMSNRRTQPDEKEGSSTSYVELLGWLRAFCETIPQVEVFQFSADDLN